MCFEKWYEEQKKENNLFGSQGTVYESLVYLSMKRAWEAAQCKVKEEVKDYEI